MVGLGIKPKEQHYIYFSNKGIGNYLLSRLARLSTPSLPFIHQKMSLVDLRINISLLRFPSPICLGFFDDRIIDSLLGVCFMNHIDSISGCKILSHFLVQLGISAIYSSSLPLDYSRIKKSTQNAPFVVQSRTLCLS